MTLHATRRLLVIAPATQLLLTAVGTVTMLTALAVILRLQPAVPLPGAWTAPATTLVDAPAARAIRTHIHARAAAGNVMMLTPKVIGLIHAPAAYAREAGRS